MTKITRKLTVLVFALLVVGAAALPVSADDTSLIVTVPGDDASLTVRPPPTPKGGGITMNCCGW